MIHIAAVIIGAVVGAAIGYSFMRYVMKSLLAHAERLMSP